MSLWLVLSGIDDFNCLWRVGNWFETCEKNLGCVYPLSRATTQGIPF